MKQSVQLRAEGYAVMAVKDFGSVLEDYVKRGKVLSEVRF